MREGLQPGVTNTLEIVVEPTSTAAAMGNPGVAVLGTPAVLLLAERAAHGIVWPYLEDGESAVGTRVELEHLAPALPGTTVSCTARLLGITGRRLSFAFEVRDAHETLARGHYGNYVLPLAALLARAARKGPQSS